MSRRRERATVSFDAAPMGGLEKLVTTAAFLIAAAALGGGFWTWQNVNDWGGLAAMAVGAVLAVAPFANRLRLPSTYEVSQTALRGLRGDRELARLSFADYYAVDMVAAPYFPHRFSMDPRALFADAFGWNGAFVSADLGEHRLIGTDVRRAVALLGDEKWVVTPADPEEFVRVVAPRLRGRKRPSAPAP